jgi:hypothetical protein
MKDWRHRLDGESTCPLGELFDLAESGEADGIGIGPVIRNGRLQVDPLVERWVVCDTSEALRAFLSSAPVALAAAPDEDSNREVTRASLAACPVPTELVESAGRRWAQQLAAQWKRAERVGLSEEIGQAFDRVAAELYGLGLNDLMDLEKDRRHLMNTEE